MGNRRTVLAATCWIAAGVVYLVAETIAASAFPGYSYAQNYISDLGVPADSPAHLVMNTGLVLHGLLFASAALLTIHQGFTHGRVIIGLAVVNGLGNVLVGLVHSGTDGVFGSLHWVGAAMAIVGGNFTALTVGLSLRRSSGDRVLGTTCLVLGVVGMVSIIALAVDGASVDLLADGVWERLAVYAITAFELLIGAAMVLRVRRPAVLGSAG